MRRKISTSSVKWTQKNRVYLETLGILDARTGGVKKSGMSLNKFINESISLVLESEKTTLRASTKDLEKAWIKFQVAQKNKQIHDITEEIMVMVSKGKGVQKIEIEIEEEKAERRQNRAPFCVTSM